MIERRRQTALLEILKRDLYDAAISSLERKGLLKLAFARLDDRSADPYSLAEELVRSALLDPSSR
jgi:hypothetical protein